MRRRKRTSALLAATSLALLWSWAAIPPSVGRSLCRVSRYYHALEESGVRTGIVERLVFSVILTKAEKTASAKNSTSFS